MLLDRFAHRFLALPPTFIRTLDLVVFMSVNRGGPSSFGAPARACGKPLVIRQTLCMPKLGCSM
jgi:hypothetical protein